MNKADVIIILSCGFNKNDIDKETKSRVKKAVKLYKKRVSNKILMSGGIFNGKSISYLMKKYAVGLGVKSKDLFIEEKSKDTIGNAVFSKSIIKKNKWKNIIIVTSDYHLKRSLYIFKHVFGEKYKIVGVKSRTNFLSKWRNKRYLSESEGLAFAGVLFAGVKSGDDVSVKKRLLKTPKYN
ncbi:MAG: YdcF family protein [Candidatus Woesearchaeota archaeon]